MNLAYDDRGGTGDPVLFIAGRGGAGRTWHLHQVPAFQRAGYRCITFDNRGIGKTENAEGFTLATMVGDTASIIEQVVGGPVRVVGVSMWSYIAQELMVARPELVSQAVLMATRGRLRWVLRLLPENIPAMENLALPPAAIKAFLECKNGLYLVCGATGSGKSVAINSMLSVISMIFFMIVDSGVRILLGGIRIFNKDFGLRPELRSKPRGFFGGVLEWIVMFAIFQITGQMTKIIQMFVMRARESAADATGSLMTGKPCDLASALIKLVAYVEKNRQIDKKSKSLTGRTLINLFFENSTRTRTTDLSRTPKRSASLGCM